SASARLAPRRVPPSSPRRIGAVHPGVDDVDRNLRRGRTGAAMLSSEALTRCLFPLLRDDLSGRPLDGALVDRPAARHHGHPMPEARSTLQLPTCTRDT